jgi:hypothetical protein
MTPVRRRVGRAEIVLAAVLSACSYDAADTGLGFETNTCTQPADCADGSECRDGMCVAQRADTPLRIALQVTPARTVDGSDPLPLVLDEFTVEGPMLRTFELPPRVDVVGTVRDAGARVDAEVTFVPVDAARGFAARVIAATVSADTAERDADFRVRLLRGRAYRVVVRPTDRSLPPYRRTFTAIDSGDDLSVEYASLIADRRRTYTVTNAPADRSLLVRALDLATGEQISSTATVTEGSAVLQFASDPPPFRLEIRAEQTYALRETAMLDATACDTETPEFPLFSVAEADLEPGEDGHLRIDMPEIPQRIRFEGAVALCTDAAGARAAGPFERLPITLHARSLLLTSESKLTATYDATTTATLDEASAELRFCVEVMAGDYDVLASPALSVPCALYAERRVIAAPRSGSHASGALLQLPNAAYLKGSLATTERAPVSAAAVDAIALQRSGDIELTPEDASVTRYNRSRRTETDQAGDFTLVVDVGTYDVVVKPPSGSGFSWQVRHDVRIGRRGDFSTRLEMISPVAIEGRLRDRSEEHTLDGAEVAAFAIIDDEAAGSDAPAAQRRRAVPIGRTTAATGGSFTLLLPPSIHQGW